MSSADRAAFNRDLRKYQKLLGVKRDAALDAVAINIQRMAIANLNRNGTNNFGNLSNSIFITRTISGGRRVATETGYGLYIEFGTRPGHFPPVEALTGQREALDQWVERKLRVNKKEAPGIAFAVARKIFHKGTKAQPFLRPAFEKEKRRIFTELQKRMK